MGGNESFSLPPLYGGKEGVARGDAEVEGVAWGGGDVGGEDGVWGEEAKRDESDGGDGDVGGGGIRVPAWGGAAQGEVKVVRQAENL